MQLHKAELRDLPALTALEADVFGPTGDAFTARQIRYLVRRAQAEVWVAAEGPELLGWVAAPWRRQGPHLSGRIYTLTIGPKAQGRGVGRALLETALDALERRGVTRVFLEVAVDNQPAVRLYRKLGFQEIGKLADYYAPGRDALHMLRQSSGKGYPLLNTPSPTARAAGSPGR